MKIIVRQISSPYLVVLGDFSTFLKIKEQEENFCTNPLGINFTEWYDHRIFIKIGTDKALTLYFLNEAY